MGYPGGKAGAGVYQRIINEIPPHDVYVEPFLGDGAVLRRKRPAARSIGVELCPGNAARFAGEGLEVEVYNCCGIEWLKHAFGLYRVSAEAAGCRGGIPRPTPADSAAAAVAAGNGGPDRAAGNGVARSTDVWPPSPNHAAAAAAAESGGVASADHFRGAPEMVPPRWFVYCDPPYLLSTRRSRSKLYDHELTEEQHVELLQVLLRLPCLVAISGYWSRLYAAALEEWRSISFDACTRGGRMGREYLWMNYPPPEELHDYRYLGGDKRERERVNRKVRTWSAGLARLPRLERLAILAELGPVSPTRQRGATEAK